MSNRRDFLRSIGIGVGTFMFAPQLLKGVDISSDTEPTLPKEFSLGDFKDVSVEERKFTEGFFEYLKNNNVGFKWERTKSPVFQTKGGQVFHTQRRQLITTYETNWESSGVYEVEYTNFSAATHTHYKPKSEKEYHEILYHQISNEILKMKPERIYIYSLAYMPLIYNPYNFEARRNIILTLVVI